MNGRMASQWPRRRFTGISWHSPGQATGAVRFGTCRTGAVTPQGKGAPVSGWQWGHARQWTMWSTTTRGTVPEGPERSASRPRPTSPRPARGRNGCSRRGNGSRHGRARRNGTVSFPCGPSGHPAFAPSHWRRFGAELISGPSLDGGLLLFLPFRPGYQLGLPGHGLPPVPLFQHLWQHAFGPDLPTPVFLHPWQQVPPTGLLRLLLVKRGDVKSWACIGLFASMALYLQLGPSHQGQKTGLTCRRSTGTIKLSRILNDWIPE